MCLFCCLYIHEAREVSVNYPPIGIARFGYILVCVYIYMYMVLAGELVPVPLFGGCRVTGMLRTT